MIWQRAADMDLVDVETALLSGAMGDYAAEAAVLLLVNDGHWLPQLHAEGLITLAVDGDEPGGPWADVDWAALDGALAAGVLSGDERQRLLLRAAAGIADGGPLDLGDLLAGLDRRSLTLLLAALAHAAGSHEHREVSHDPDGVAHPGHKLPPLVPWPPRA